MTAADLEAWLTRHNLTITDGARVLGISRSQMHRLLIGQCPIGKPIQSLCAAIDRHPDVIEMIPGGRPSVAR